MRIVCPYCGQGMTGEMDPPPLSLRKMRIYKAVLAAGPEGILPEDLLVRMYGDEEWPTPSGPGVMRTLIFEINNVIRERNECIIARPRRRYRLVSLEQRADEQGTKAKIQSDQNHHGGHSDPAA